MYRFSGAGTTRVTHRCCVDWWVEPRILWRCRCWPRRLGDTGQTSSRTGTCRWAVWAPGEEQWRSVRRGTVPGGLRAFIWLRPKPHGVMVDTTVGSVLGAPSPVGRGLPVVGGGVLYGVRRWRRCQRWTRTWTVPRLAFSKSVISYSPVSQSGLSLRSAVLTLISDWFTHLVE